MRLWNKKQPTLLAIEKRLGEGIHDQKIEGLRDEARRITRLAGLGETYVDNWWLDMAKKSNIEPKPDEKPLDFRLRILGTTEQALLEIFMKDIKATREEDTERVKKVWTFFILAFG